MYFKSYGMKNFKISFLLSFFILTCTSLYAQDLNLALPEFEKAIETPGAQLLDVRTPAEFRSGYINHAMLANWNDPIEFEKLSASLDPSKPVYTYCLSGGRSKLAAEWLRSHGFTTYNLTGGITSWKKAGNPTVVLAEEKQMTLADFTDSLGSQTVLVDFNAPWCPPCVKMNPIVDSLAQASNAQFKLLKIDGATQTELSKMLHVEGFPVFIVYKNGKEVWRKKGVVSAAELINHL